MCTVMFMFTLNKDVHKQSIIDYKKIHVKKYKRKGWLKGKNKEETRKENKKRNEQGSFFSEQLVLGYLNCFSVRKLGKSSIAVLGSAENKILGYMGGVI